MSRQILMVMQGRNGGGTEKHVRDVANGLRQRGWDVDVVTLQDGLWCIWRAMYGKDIIHFFLPRPYVIGSLLAMLRGINCRIMSRRSLAASYHQITFIERWLHMHTKILIGNSPAVVNELRQEAPTADIRLIRNGV